MRMALTVNDISTEKAGYTTTHLAMEATNLGHDIYYINVADFSLKPDDRPSAWATPSPRKRFRSTAAFLRDLTGKTMRRRQIDIADLDVLWLRNDPAEDVIRRPWARLAAINFGRFAQQSGVIVLNDPKGLMMALTKLYLEEFPEVVRPKSLISRDKPSIKSYIKELGGYAILKPLIGSGGRNVFLAQPEDVPNLNQMIDAVSRESYLIVQEYLPKAVHGDTRLFLMNGSPLTANGKVAAFHRQRRRGDQDLRSNMSAGAIAVKAKITDQMLQLAEIVRPKLVKDGMFMVGLDIVGDKLMEINVMSPGGLNDAQLLEKAPFCRQVIHAVERKVAYAQDYHRHFDNAELATL
jgi:glutathione synthase